MKQTVWTTKRRFGTRSVSNCRNRIFRCIATIQLAASISFAAAPQVTRVEPPNWWVGHSHNPVRLLISGEHLEEVRVEAPAGFRVGSSQCSTNGKYLFVDLHIPAASPPGMVSLMAVSKDGASQFSFPLLPPPARKAGARGISTEDVIYLILPDRFANGDRSNDDPAVSRGVHDRSRPRRYHGGDFQGVLDHLDYLRELGITTLWLTPWYDNVNHLNEIQIYSRDHTDAPMREPSADYHGYGVVDFYATEEHFGDMERLRKLTDAAHVSGMKIIQDQVVNLTSPYHPWLTNLPTPTWFNGNFTNHLTNAFQTWTMTVANPPPEPLKATLEGWFFNYLPDLNQNDPELATYLIQNSLWWIGMANVDAVRQDALPYVPRAYWARWAAAMKRAYPRLTILGEMWDGDPKRVAFFQGGQKRFDGVDSGVDTLFDFPLHYAIRDVFAKSGPMTRLTETLAGDVNYVNPTTLITFLGLHDQPRFSSEPGATGDGLKLAFTFLLTTRGTPLIYYGDEIGMRGENDPDNRRDFPGGWPEDARNAFADAGRSAEQADVFAHVKKLLKLRKETAALRRGKLVNLAVNRDTYAFARITPDSRAVVVMNNSTRRQRVEANLAGVIPATALTDRLGDLGTVKITGNKMVVTLPPRTAAIFTP